MRKAPRILRWRCWNQTKERESTDSFGSTENMKAQIYKVEESGTPRTTDTNSLRPPLNRGRKRNQGFSLIEMLTVIMIIGLLVAIAVPTIGNTNDAAKLSRNKRNAQNIASIFIAAQAAGVDFFAAGDKDQTVLNVVNGGTVSSGAFAGEFFGVPGIGANERADAANYLDLEHGMLVYRADG